MIKLTQLAAVANQQVNLPSASDESPRAVVNEHLEPLGFEPYATAEDVRRFNELESTESFAKLARREQLVIATKLLVQERTHDESDEAFLERVRLTEKAQESFAAALTPKARAHYERIKGHCPTVDDIISEDAAKRAIARYVRRTTFKNFSDLADQCNTAMDGIGTDEVSLLSALHAGRRGEPMSTKDWHRILTILPALYEERFGRDLLADINGELTGADQELATHITILELGSVPSFRPQSTMFQSPGTVEKASGAVRDWLADFKDRINEIDDLPNPVFLTPFYEINSIELKREQRELHKAVSRIGN